MEKIKYAIFDADGTLLDTMHIWDTVDNAFLYMRGIVPEEDKIFHRYGYFNAVNHMIEKYNLDMTPEEVREDIMMILRYYYNNVAKEKDGVKEFLQALKNNGVHCVVATATDKSIMEPTLERLGLAEYFEAVFSTKDTGISKHDPHIYNLARDFLGAKDDLFIFEDAAYAIDTAKKAGYRIVAVEDYSAERDREHIKKIADYYVSAYSELYGIFDL